VSFIDHTALLDELIDLINPNAVNALYCNLHTQPQVQDGLVRMFPGTKFWHCKIRVAGVFNVDERREILVAEHNRAHRAAQENVKQVLSEYYFPKMAKLAKEIAESCRICSAAKYDRHPKRQELGETPIPETPGEFLRIDIFSTDKKFLLTCVDKFSKFAVVQPIQSRTIEDLKTPLLQLMNFFHEPEQFIATTSLR